MRVRADKRVFGPPMRIADMRDVFAPLVGGAVALAALLGIYFSALTLVSGWSFTVSQFGEFWPYIVPLAAGFGLQVGLYLHLRQLTARHHYANQVVAASGTTSTAAMLACCTHYLANVLPALGAVGVATLVAQYQIQLFWVGLVFNAAGIVYVANQVYSAKRAFKEMHACSS
jgi:Cu+-exporting ATPase